MIVDLDASHYRLGLNTLASKGVEFDPRPTGGSGGIYFCEMKYIVDWLGEGNTLCIVKPAADAIVVPLDKNRFKTDKLRIMETRDIRTRATWEYLLRERVINLFFYLPRILDWTVATDNLTVLRLFNRKVTCPKNVMSRQLVMAACRGCLPMVRYLYIEAGAREDLERALCHATEKGHHEVVEFLVDKVTDLRTITRAIRWTMLFTEQPSSQQTLDILRAKAAVLDASKAAILNATAKVAILNAAGVGRDKMDDDSTMDDSEAGSC